MSLIRFQIGGKSWERLGDWLKLLGYYVWWLGHEKLLNLMLIFWMGGSMDICCLGANGQHPFTHLISSLEPTISIWQHLSSVLNLCVLDGRQPRLRSVSAFLYSSNRDQLKMATWGPFIAKPRTSVRVSWGSDFSLPLRLNQEGIKWDLQNPSHYYVQHENKIKLGRKPKPGRGTEKSPWRHHLTNEGICTWCLLLQNMSLYHWTIFMHMNQQILSFLVKPVWVDIHIHHNPKS